MTPAPTPKTPVKKKPAAKTKKAAKEPIVDPIEEILAGGLSKDEISQEIKDEATTVAKTPADFVEYSHVDAPRELSRAGTKVLSFLDRQQLKSGTVVISVKNGAITEILFAKD
jgi:hypothetical protein